MVYLWCQAGRTPKNKNRVSVTTTGWASSDSSDKPVDPQDKDLHDIKTDTVAMSNVTQVASLCNTPPRHGSLPLEVEWMYVIHYYEKQGRPPPPFCDPN